MVKVNGAVIVTGATGFLGSYVVKALEQDGYRVLAMGRDLRKGVELNNGQTRFVYLELTDKNKVFSVLSELTANYQIQSVIHCAALSSAWGKASDFQKANVEATKYLLDAVAHYQIPRFVFVSSTSVYFNFKDQWDISEDSPVARPFANAYAQSKYQAEREVLKFKDKIHTVIIRPRGLIGVGDPAIAPRLMKVSERGWFPLIRGGQAQIDITYIKNVADALLLAMNADITSGEIFNISNGEPIKVKSLVSQLIQLANINCSLVKVPYPVIMASAGAMESAATMFGTGEPLYTRYSVGLIAISQTLNIDKARNLLGYQPKYSIDFAIKEYVQHLGEQHA